MRGPAPLLVHGRLLSAYGPQGWWPVTPARGGEPVYRPGFRGRLTQAQKAEVCAGAILTQNTSWNNVKKAMANLRRAGIRGLGDLAGTPVRRLEGLVRPSGYFRQKARKLQVFARHAERRGRLSRWLSGPLEGLREELLGLWGVGPETADSILLYAGARPAFVVDAYTLRIGRRLGWFSAGRQTSYHEAQGFLVSRLRPSARLYGEMHALLVEHAKRHCRTKPACQGCPLLSACRYGMSHG